jgi:hypothetical protein
MGPKFKERLTLLAGIILVLWNRILIRLGLRRRVDGWGRGAGLVLRGEAATFVLSAFGLDVWSDVREASSIQDTQEHLAGRLAQFLAGEPVSYVQIRRGDDQDFAEAAPVPSYTLGFQKWISGPERFIRPDDWTGRIVSIGAQPKIDVLFNIICRIAPDGSADLWVRVNHIGTDGVPVQEMLTRLETSWGLSGEVKYPSPEEFAPFHGPRHCAGREGLGEVQAFLDFTPLLTWRKVQNARLPEPMTISAAFLWRIGRHKAFSGLYLGTTVDLPETDGLGRGVGVVVTRPSDYSDDEDGLGRYVRAFNRELNLTRARQSESMKTLDAAGLIPAKFETVLLRHGLDQGRAFGSMALTILKDASVFGAPLADAGHVDGFIALGSAALTTRDGRKVGCVTIKGPHQRIADYPRLLSEAVGQTQQ